MSYNYVPVTYKFGKLYSKHFTIDFGYPNFILRLNLHHEYAKIKLFFHAILQPAEPREGRAVRLISRPRNCEANSVFTDDVTK